MIVPMAQDWLSNLGSVVGIGVGSMDLMLVRNSFQPGDTIHGRVQLKLTNPTEAKALVAIVEASRRRSVRRSDGTRTTETTSVYRFEQQLDGKRTYKGEAYDLHLPIAPKTKLELPEGTLGDVVRFVSAVRDVVAEPITWRVSVYLDIPWKVNVKAHQDISVA
jgi:hypothetical protein